MRDQSVSGRVLIVDAEHGLARLYADRIDTHCPGVRVDVCDPSEAMRIEDNAGGADLAIVSCESGTGACLETLRVLLSVRSCLAVLVLTPADRPELVDAAIRAGATDSLVRVPGYLDQLAACVRKNILIAKRGTASRSHADAAERERRELRIEVRELRREAAATYPATEERAGTIHVTRMLAVPGARAA